MIDKKAISDDLLNEKNLWAVYCLSRKLGVPWGALVPAILLFVALLAFSFSMAGRTEVLISHTRQVMDLGISLTSTMLGFLVAGFTIFATLTNPQLLVQMARITDKTTSLSWLKTAFTPFMHVFAHYTAFLVLTVFCKLLSFPGGVLPSVLASLPHYQFELYKAVIAALGFSLFASWLFYLTLLLGRFIFNIYHSCMLSIASKNEDLIDN